MGGKDAAYYGSGATVPVSGWKPHGGQAPAPTVTLLCQASSSSTAPSRGSQQAKPWLPFAAQPADDPGTPSDRYRSVLDGLTRLPLADAADKESFRVCIDMEKVLSLPSQPSQNQAVQRQLSGRCPAGASQGSHGRAASPAREALAA